MSSTARPAPVARFTSETATVDGVRLHNRLGGDPDGPPVLLWHGFLGTSYAWPQSYRRLRSAGRLRNRGDA